MLLITHDLSVVADIADRVVVMQQGEAVESGTVQQVLHAPQHPQRLLAAIPGAGTRGQWLTGSDPLAHTPVREHVVTGSATPVLAVDNVSQAFSLPDGGVLQAVNNVIAGLRRDIGHCW